MSGLIVYALVNSHGAQHGAWDEHYRTIEDATEAMRKAMRWESIVLSGGYTVQHPGDGPGRASGEAWSVYETQEECDADQDGADAPRIIQLRTTVEMEDSR